MQVQQRVGRELTTHLYPEIQVTRPSALWNYVNNSLYRQVVEIDLLHEEVRNDRWCLGCRMLVTVIMEAFWILAVTRSRV